VRVLLDSDVVLDLLLERQPFFNESAEIFKLLENKNFEAFISPITAVNAFYFVRKAKDITIALDTVKIYCRSSKFAPPIEESSRCFRAELYRL
jgi:predicted nucleic acid-binding protein